MRPACGCRATMPVFRPRRVFRHNAARLKYMRTTFAQQEPTWAAPSCHRFGCCPPTAPGDVGSSASAWPPRWGRLFCDGTSRSWGEPCGAGGFRQPIAWSLPVIAFVIPVEDCIGLSPTNDPRAPEVSQRRGSLLPVGLGAKAGSLRTDSPGFGSFPGLLFQGPKMCNAARIEIRRTALVLAPGGLAKS